MTPEREIEQQRQIIWLLVRQVGGTADISAAEYADAPRRPALTVQVTETGFRLEAPDAKEGMT